MLKTKVLRTDEPETLPHRRENKMLTELKVLCLSHSEKVSAIYSVNQVHSYQLEVQL